MLRVRVDTTPHDTTLLVEGRLAGPWVDELAGCWAKLIAEHDARSIRVDLEGVTFIGAAGKALLRQFHDRGAVLVGHGCMTRAIVEEITRRSPT